MTTLPSLTSYFWFLPLDWNTGAYLFYSFLKKNFMWCRKWPLADVFLLVLFQFRLSHIRPLGAIYSLIGSCMCSVQTFGTEGAVYNYGQASCWTHSTYVEQMLQSASRQAAKKKKKTQITTTQHRGWGQTGLCLTWPPAHTHLQPLTHTHTHSNLSSVPFLLLWNSAF